MLDGLSYSLIFYILFFIIIGLGILIGFLRGLKKSLYSFIVKLIFFVIFFLTVDLVASKLWGMNMPFLGGLIGQFFPELSDATSLKQVIPTILDLYLNDSFESAVSNEEFVTFISSLSLLIVKIVYAIFYFTVFNLIYKFIFFIIRSIFLRTNKDSKEIKRRGLGALCGLLSGTVSLYFVLIMLGGTMSVAGSAQRIVPDNYKIEPLEQVTNAYNQNVVVSAVNVIGVKDNATNKNIPLNLYLFDSVFSFNYRDEQISLRKELTIAADVFDIYSESDYKESNNLSDITGTEIRNVFTKLSGSNLFIAALPLGIETASDYLDTDITVPKDKLYAIDWGSEVMQLGEVAAVSFDLINTAGLINDDVDLETRTIDGNNVRSLFNSLSDSKLATLAAYEAIQPILATAGAEVEAIITVPEDLVWEEEFKAIGLVAGAIVDTGISVGNLKSGNPSQMMSSLSELDFTVILNSKILSHALINAFTGKGEMDDFDVFVIPDDIVWFDVCNEQGDIIEKGELRNLLQAFNEVSHTANIFDFANLDMSVIADLTDENINNIFDSRVLVATASNVIIDKSGDVLTIPNKTLLSISVNSVDRDILSKEEMKKMFKAVSALGFTDLENMTFDASIIKNLATSEDPKVLDQTKADTLFNSDIIHATFSTMLFDLTDGDSNVLIVPCQDVDTEVIRYFDEEIEYVSTDELNEILEAVLVLDITDFAEIETLEINLIINNIDTLLESAVMHATMSKQINDLSPETLLIPTKDIDDNEIHGDVSGIDYIYKTEIKDIFNALQILEVSDISAFTGSFNLSKLADTNDQTTLLKSASIHATISKKLFDLDDAVLVVPIYSQVGESEAYRIQKEVSLTNFVVKDEIKSIIDALLAMEYTDLDSIGASIDSSKFFNEREKILLSSSIQATLSNKLLNDTNGKLVVPDENIDSELIRIVMSDVTYIEIEEMKDLLTALELLNLTDFDNITINPTDVFNADFDILLASASMQATISDNILANALDDSAAAGSGTLIVPVYFRETILVNTSSIKQIEKIELKALLTSLEILNISDFSGSMDASAITSKTDQELSTMLESGSIHVTFDNMLKGNTNISDKIPDLAKENAYGMTGITTKIEIKAFIKAANILTDTGDFTTVTFDLTSISSLTEAERSIVLDSMIVRNSLTMDLEAIIDSDPSYSVDNTYYENEVNTTFFTKPGIIIILTHYNYI